MKIENIDDTKFFSFIYEQGKKMLLESIDAYYFITSLDSTDSLTICNAQGEEVLHVLCRYSHHKQKQIPIFEIVRSSIPPYSVGKLTTTLAAICFKENSSLSCSIGPSAINRIVRMAESWITYPEKNLTEVSSTFETEHALKQYSVAGAFPGLKFNPGDIFIGQLV